MKPEKFCFSCQTWKPQDTMQKVKRNNNIYRWICASCMERRSKSIYKSKDKK